MVVTGIVSFLGRFVSKWSIYEQNEAICDQSGSVCVKCGSLSFPEHPVRKAALHFEKGAMPENEATHTCCYS